MAKESGVWGLQGVRDQQLQDQWSYDGAPGIRLVGYNPAGQLGQNNTTNYSSPVQVGQDTTSAWTEIMRIDAGAEAANNNQLSGAIKADGSLWLWGGNYGSGMDAGSPGGNYSSPIQLPGTWSRIAFGGESSWQGVRDDNTLWAWGSNWGGALGQGQTPGQLGSSNSPLQIPGTTWATGSDKARQGNYGALAIRTDGTLWGYGYSNKQLGLGGVQAPNAYGTSPMQVPGTGWDKLIGFGWLHSGCVKTDNTLWMWGNNEHGQLGTNQENPGTSSSPKQVPGTNWKQGTALMKSTLAIRTDGTLWAWGGNDQGRLGLNQSTPVKISSPTQVGTDTDWGRVDGTRGSSVYAVKTDGTMWSWGYNYHGQLGQNSTTYYSSPVQIPGTGWSTTIGASGGIQHMFGAFNF